MIVPPKESRTPEGLPSGKRGIPLYKSWSRPNSIMSASLLGGDLRRNFVPSSDLLLATGRIHVKKWSPKTLRKFSKIPTL